MQIYNLLHQEQYVNVLKELSLMGESSNNDTPLNPIMDGTGHQISRSLDRGVDQSAIVSSVFVL
jgi:hypothetical protein